MKNVGFKTAVGLVKQANIAEHDSIADMTRKIHKVVWTRVKENGIDDGKWTDRFYQTLTLFLAPHPDHTVIASSDMKDIKLGSLQHIACKLLGSMTSTIALDRSVLEGAYSSAQMSKTKRSESARLGANAHGAVQAKEAERLLELLQDATSNVDDNERSDSDVKGFDTVDKAEVFKHIEDDLQHVCSMLTLKSGAIPVPVLPVGQLVTSALTVNEGGRYLVSSQYKTVTQQDGKNVSVLKQSAILSNLGPFMKEVDETKPQSYHPDANKGIQPSVIYSLTARRGGRLDQQAPAAAPVAAPVAAPQHHSTDHVDNVTTGGHEDVVSDTLGISDVPMHVPTMYGSNIDDAFWRSMRVVFIPSLKRALTAPLHWPGFDVAKRYMRVIVVETWEDFESYRTYWGEEYIILLMKGSSIGQCRRNIVQFAQGKNMTTIYMADDSLLVTSCRHMVHNGDTEGQYVSFTAVLDMLMDTFLLSVQRRTPAAILGVNSRYAASLTAPENVNKVMTERCPTGLVLVNVELLCKHDINYNDVKAKEDVILAFQCNKARLPVLRIRSISMIDAPLLDGGVLASYGSSSESLVPPNLGRLLQPSP
jgi:hypothetical protein